MKNTKTLSIFPFKCSSEYCHLIKCATNTKRLRNTGLGSYSFNYFCNKVFSFITSENKFLTHITKEVFPRSNQNGEVDGIKHKVRGRP